MGRKAEAQEERRARAFAPGHVTGLFAPALDASDPRARGSIGAGVVLEAGVHASVRILPARRRTVDVASELHVPLPISREVAERLFAHRTGRLSVELRHELPVGQGFGMSAAGALATALAVAAVLGLPRSKAIETAHLADLFGGGGLGGVSAILRGGFEVRERPGIPPFGRARHMVFGRPILLSVVGRPIPSPVLLRDPTFLGRVRAAAAPELARLGDRPDAEAFLSASERFTDSVRLPPPRMQKLIPTLRSSGARVAQAMFGSSFFAVPRSSDSRARLIRRLQRLGLPAIEVHAARTGARVVR
ncbi:MAG TPA: hypothetical protein VGS23_06305 [Thermoplasmata archaeon]|nr:hypothetical protein [Thermoplasmata archaeon]